MLWPIKTMRSNAASVWAGRSFHEPGAASSQQGSGIEDRLTGGIAECPELVMPSDDLVGLQPSIMGAHDRGVAPRP